MRCHGWMSTRGQQDGAACVVDTSGASADQFQLDRKSIILR